jgi:hypothetical protein
MELLSALKQCEGTLSLTGDKISTLAGKLEDLLFRAQRIAAAKKNNLKSTDTMFGYDLQNLRRDIRSFSNDMGGLPTVIGSIERTAVYDEGALRYAQSVMRLAERVAKLVKALADQALLAHTHIRESDSKIEAWYLVQEAEQLAQRGQTLPSIANKIVIKVSTPPAT